MTHYPGAEWVPWKYESSQGPAYFRGANKPIAAVLHIAQGYMSTARSWATSGHFGASWHFSVGRDGSIMQHLDFEDGGYHAGIPDTAPKPTWKLWRGYGINANLYTIGIEHEGFSGDGFTDAQRQSSRDLCRWLAGTLGFTYDRDHFPPHADIDLINRPSDFGPPEYREQHYAFMFEEDSMSAEDKARLDAIEKVLTGGVSNVIEDWNKTGNSLLMGYGLEQDKLARHIANHPGPSKVGPHTHIPGEVQ